MKGYINEAGDSNRCIANIRNLRLIARKNDIFEMNIVFLYARFTVYKHYYIIIAIIVQFAHVISTTDINKISIRH